ncbi:flagella basal body P-ring formation protein FlgA [compost metagenome]
MWVDAWVDDRFVRTTAVTFEVSAWAPLTVATTQMDSGAAVDAVLLRGGTEARDVDLASIKQGAPIDAGINGRFSELEAGRQRLRKPLKAGEVLTRAHLESMPAVVRGNWALLQARSGDVAVESRVEVLQDGREGQFVRVKVTGAKGEVLARVTGPGQVEVQP